MAYDADPRVDAYIDPLPDWEQDICRRVRELVHAADPEIAETIKRTTQPYFVSPISQGRGIGRDPGLGNVCALYAAKDHVNVFLYDPTVPDPEGIITGGHDNKTGRTIAVYRDEFLPEDAFKAMIAQIAANNRAGGWRKLKRER